MISVESVEPGSLALGSSLVIQPATTPVIRRVRAYFAPVDRATGTSTFFDPAQAASFDLDAPPAPWVDLGWIESFARKSNSKVVAVAAGAPATTELQVRQEMDAFVSLCFRSWGKLQLALAAGSEQMNLLQTLVGATALPSGGPAAVAVALQAGSTATSLVVGTAASNFSVGQMVAVDVDYTGQIGFVGSGVSCAYVSSSSSVNNDSNYIRRVTMNVGRIVSIGGSPPSTLTLGQPLIAGATPISMKVQALAGFVDREGGSFFQEWSALFVMPGEQGDFLCFHYPRLQSLQTGAEDSVALSGPLEWIMLQGKFRALPVVDPNDGSSALCFRSFLPSIASALG